MKKVIILFSLLFLLTACDSTETFTKKCVQKMNTETIDNTKNITFIYNNKDEVLKVIVKDKYKGNSQNIKLIKESASIYNPHMMFPLWERGFTKDLIGDFFKREAGSKSSRYIKIPYPNVYEALDLIGRAGGIPVTAHPGEYDSLKLTAKLAKEGLIKGIEYNHPRNTDSDRKQIVSIAREYNLFLTGGTDYHGPNTSTVNPLGTFLCPQEGLLALLKEKNPGFSI